MIKGMETHSNMPGLRNDIWKLNTSYTKHKCYTCDLGIQCVCGHGFGGFSYHKIFVTKQLTCWIIFLGH